jgi:hypothetical protein
VIGAARKAPARVEKVRERIGGGEELSIAKGAAAVRQRQ